MSVIEGEYQEPTFHYDASRKYKWLRRFAEAGNPLRVLWCQRCGDREPHNILLLGVTLSSKIERNFVKKHRFCVSKEGT